MNRDRERGDACRDDEDWWRRQTAGGQHGEGLSVDDIHMAHLGTAHDAVDCRLLRRALLHCRHRCDHILSLQRLRSVSKLEGNVTIDQITITGGYIVDQTTTSR